MSIRKFLLCAAVAAFSLILPLTVSASDFNANNIIDDLPFLSTSSMSSADVQSFLTSQGGFLANWTDSVDMYSNFTYHNVTTDPNSATTTITCKVHTHTGMTAAQIIIQAATNWNPEYFANKATQIWTDSSGIKHTEYTSCGTDTTDPQPSPVITTVSPKVLLTTLQKEQSLVTATGTYSQNSSDYTNATYPSNEYALSWAMGYGVPDSGGKNGVYRGFYMQVMYAAWQLRLDTQCANGDTSKWPGFEGYSLCGGKYTVGQPRSIDGTTVTPQDGATDALYNYTPHFSGNQHFVSIYEQWFGATHVNDTMSPHPDGTLVALNNVVYLIENAALRPIADTSVFNSYRYNWGLVVPATSGDAGLPITNGISTMRPGTIFQYGDGNVYALVADQGIAKQQHISAAGFSALGYNGSDILTIPAAEAPAQTLAGFLPSSRHPDGTLVRVPGDSRVYLLDSGTRREVLFPEALYSWGFGWGDIKTGTTGDGSLPVGAPVNMREGTLFLNNNNIYAVDVTNTGLQKTIIGPWECFSNRLHFSLNNVYNLSNSFVPSQDGPGLHC